MVEEKQVSRLPAGFPLGVRSFTVAVSRCTDSNPARSEVISIEPEIDYDPPKSTHQPCP